MPTSPRLLAAVFVMRHDPPFRRTAPHLGRAAHAIALNFIQHVDPALSQQLHNHNGMMPITVSDLFQSDAEHHWLRVTGLRDDVVTTLETLAGLDKPCVDDWTLVMGLTDLHDWAGQTTLATLIDEAWREPKTLRLTFETPTAIKSKGLHRAFPAPSYIFKSLFSRWQTLTDATLPYVPSPAILETFLRYAVSVDAYQLHAERIEIKRTLIPTFKGQVSYRVIPPTPQLRKKSHSSTNAAEVLAHYDDLACWLNLLAAFGYYSGIGVKTAQGMGMMRRES